MKKYTIFILCFIFIVAGCSNNKEQSNPKNQAEQHNQEESSEHSHDAGEENNDKAGEEHHHESNLQIEFHTNNGIKVNEKANLSAHIQNEKGPLTEAKVRFEIWSDNDQAHDYVDATEEGDGVYTAIKNFLTTGTYHVKVHVEKKQDQIHDHKETTVEVK